MWPKARPGIKGAQSNFRWQTQEGGEVQQGSGGERAAAQSAGKYLTFVCLFLRNETSGKQLTLDERERERESKVRGHAREIR